MIDTSKTIGMLKARRRIINRNIAVLSYAPSFLFERDRPDDPIGDECVASHLAAHPKHNVLVKEKDVWRLVVQNLHRLVVVGLALGGIALLSRVLEQFIDFWIREAAIVLRAPGYKEVVYILVG